MKLICKSCKHNFMVDELNIDTDKVDCPKCYWPNLIAQSKLSSGHYGHFARRRASIPKLKRSSNWPRN